jgi:hypothetical protein
MSTRGCEYVWKLGEQIQAFLTAMDVAALLRAPPYLSRGIFNLLWPKGDRRVKFRLHLLMMRYFCCFRRFRWKFGTPNEKSIWNFQNKKLDTFSLSSDFRHCIKAAIE